MAWNNSLISIPGTSIKAVNLNTLPPEAWNILSGTGDGNEREVRDIYGSVATVFRGVDLRANALVKMPWQIRRTNGEDALWESGQPCPPDLMWAKNLAQLLKLTAASRTLVSEAFWFIERNRARPLSLRWWSPLAVRPHWNERAGLTHFERSANQGIMRYDVADLCYIWDVHPLHETEVKPSPAQAALAAANVLYNVDKLASSYFERGAIRATLLAVSGATSREEKERIQSWWQRVTAGVKNAFSAHVINSDSVTPVQIGDGLAELNSAELNMDKRHDVAVALGIPFSMLFADAANYATAQQDELNFYNSTVIPEAETIAEQINEQLFNRYGYHFEWLPETMDVFQQDEQLRAQAFSQYAGAGLPLSLAAEMLGLELPAGWDYAMLDETPAPQTITVIPQDVMQRQPAQITMADDGQDDEDEDDRKAIDADKLRRWLKRNPNRLTRLDDFESDALTPTDKVAIAAEFTGDASTARSLLQFAGTAKLGDGDAEDSPFPVTLPTDGRITPDWWRATKTTLQIDPNDREAEQLVRMALERRTTRTLRARFVEMLDTLYPEGYANFGTAQTEAARIHRRFLDEQALYDELSRAIQDSADLGVSVAVQQLEGVGYGFDYTLSNQHARQWAMQHTDTLLRGLAATTAERVAPSIERWIDNGEPLEALVRDLQSVFGRTRAELIASTEVTRAYAEGNRIAYEDSGVVSDIEWRTASDERVCPVCGPLDGQRRSLNNPNFSGVNSVPPAHPRCRCWIVPVVAEVGVSETSSNVPSNAVSLTQDLSPVGIPVSNAVSIPQSGKYNGVYRETLDAIDSVHGDGVLDTIPVKTNSSMQSLGEFRFSRRGAVEIRVNGKGDHLQSTLAHEIGHYLDRYAIDAQSANFYRSASADSPLMTKWKEAAENSKAIKILRDKLINPGNYAVDVEYTSTVTGVTRTYTSTPNAQHLRYLLSDEEMWARSYSQYIARKSGNPNMLRQIAMERVDKLYGNRQWDDDDFSAIESAIDEVFKALGWMK